MSPDFRFISVPKPGDAAAQRAQRRSARSHTAKQQHAKARRLRAQEYQARKQANPKPKDDTASPEQTPSLSLVLSSDRRDPFASFASPLTPVEHFLLDHFVKAVIPAMRCEESKISHVELMTRSWVPFALSDACLMQTLFLTACRHLCFCHQDSPEEDRQRFEQLAVHYKVNCVREVRNALAVREPPYSPAMVGAVVMLAFDELFVQDIVRLNQHVEGAVKMVEVSGGPQTLGVDGLLEHLLNRLLLKCLGKLGMRKAWV